MTSSAVLGLPRADALYARALERLPGGNTRTTVFAEPRPPYAATGSGCRLTDVDGHVVLDLNNNYTSLIHGHAHPAIVAAAAAAIGEGSAFGLPTRYEVDMAEMLSKRVAIGEKWRFTNSGTEAVMMAIRAARAVTGRDIVVRFDGCYHGTSEPVALGSRGVSTGTLADVLVVRRGNAEEFVETLERHGDRIAAVLIDAMPHRPGLVPVATDHLQLVRRETRSRNIIMILDEVITFRLASGGLHSVYGVEPDLISLGKIIGGGLPVGAIGGPARIMNVFDPRSPEALSHGGTFSANPVSMRAGLAALSLFGSAEIERINALGDRLRDGLNQHGWPTNGRGSLLRIDLSAAPDAWWRLYGAGIFISPSGLACISTPMDAAVVDEVLAAFERVGR